MRARNQNPLFFALRNSIRKLRTIFPWFIFQDWFLWLYVCILCVHVSMRCVHGPWGPLKGTESLKQSWKSVQLWVLRTDYAFWKGSKDSYKLLSPLFSPECSTLGCQVRASQLSLIFFCKGIRVLLLPKKHICSSDKAPSSHKKTTILLSTLKKMTSNVLLSGGVKDFLRSPEMFANKPLGLIFVENQKLCPVSPHFSEQILFWNSLLYQKFEHKHY